MKTAALIVELAGPAGSGKSTLTKALGEQPGILAGVLPDVRNPKYVFFFAWNLFLLLPTFFVLYRAKTGRWLSAQEMALLAILQGWSRVLKRQAASGAQLIVLDQGPVYILSELLRFGPEYLQGAGAQLWWEQTCQRWAATLDRVVCIDTADETLMMRIRSREKSHGIKENPDEWAIGFLARYRAAQEKVLSSFASGLQSPKVIRFDTAHMSVDETLTNILALRESR
jgi:deoxyadenosine/deoxycytidine kinase